MLSPGIAATFEIAEACLQFPELLATFLALRLPAVATVTNFPDLQTIGCRTPFAVCVHVLGLP
jgi:hypothetical protein